MLLVTKLRFILLICPEQINALAYIQQRLPCWMRAGSWRKDLNWIIHRSSVFIWLVVSGPTLQHQNIGMHKLSLRSLFIPKRFKFNRTDTISPTLEVMRGGNCHLVLPESHLNNTLEIIFPKCSQLKLQRNISNILHMLTLYLFLNSDRTWAISC